MIILQLLFIKIIFKFNIYFKKRFYLISSKSILPNEFIFIKESSSILSKMFSNKKNDFLDL